MHTTRGLLTGKTTEGQETNDSISAGSILKGMTREMRNMSGLSFLFYKGSHRCKGSDLYSMQ